MQNEGQNNLYVTLEDYVPKSVLKNKNKAKSWKYGYDEKYDLVVISKTGDIGEIVSIQGLPIALPLAPKKVYKRSGKKQEQYQGKNKFVHFLASKSHLNASRLSAFSQSDFAEWVLRDADAFFIQSFT